MTDARDEDDELQGWVWLRLGFFANFLFILFAGAYFVCPHCGDGFMICIDMQIPSDDESAAKAAFPAIKRRLTTVDEVVEDLSGSARSTTPVRSSRQRAPLALMASSSSLQAPSAPAVLPGACLDDAGMD